MYRCAATRLGRPADEDEEEGDSGHRARPTPTKAPDDNDFGANDWLLEEMYEQYAADPSSVDETWAAYFQTHGAPGAGNGQPEQAAPVARRTAPPEAKDATVQPAARAGASSPAAHQSRTGPGSRAGRAGCGEAARARLRHRP